MLCRKVRWFHILIFVIVALFYTEYGIFYLSVQKCEWPCPINGCSESDLKAFMISDTHLLGYRKGHWLDKLKREWQMYQSYQSAIRVHDPETVFFLGDLLDEGQWANGELFQTYSKQFRDLFGDLKNKERKGPKIYAIAGNHDLGFHYAISPFTLELFEKEFNRTSIDEIFVKGYRFVLINSMALHGDGCRLCHEAVEKLKKLKRDNTNKKNPVVLQHFPLHREDDSECEKVDEIHVVDNDEKYRERWETISVDATMQIIDNLKPKAVFGGHTHKMCKKRWTADTYNFNEYTVNSFSWRNGDRPAFLMVVVNNEQVRVAYCRLPSEKRQIQVYIFIIFVLSLWILLNVYWGFREKYRISKLSIPLHRLSPFKVE